MKIDSLSSLAEVMPYYGTFDEVYRLMRSFSIKTKNIFEGWKTIFGQVIIRKKIKLDIITLFEYMSIYNTIIKLILSMFEVYIIEIKTKVDYEKFISKVKEFQDIQHIKINQINMCLSTKDDFSITYESIWNQIVYNDDDRSLDELYNKAINTIKQLNINVESIKSFLFLEELKNRKIISWDRVIAIISEEMDSTSFLKHLNEIK